MLLHFGLPAWEKKRTLTALLILASQIEKRRKRGKKESEMMGVRGAILRRRQPN
jgi:hypothetical protein